MIAVNPAARADASLLGNSGPYRAVRLQVFNWGTFSNIHDIPISAKGFLFVGASGSGKSTLIDAMATLLFPNPNYNAAAREGEKRRGDRTLLSYVRGAWATQTEIDPSGATRSVVQHLRRNATFSAIALTFADRFKNLTTLMLAAAIRKSANDESSVRRRWFIIEGGYDFNARDFEGFARSGLDWRWLKNALPPAEDFETFASYSDAFCRLFGIREKTALKLLAKAQSAKNLGDLNAFLRNFMLEEPRTFEIARTLVEEFNDLREAHDAVVAERRKAECLSRARDAWASHGQAEAELGRLKREMNAIPWWRFRTEAALLEAELPQAVKRLDASEHNLAAARKKEAAASALWEELKRRHLMSGGDQIDHLKRELKSASFQAEQTLRRRSRLEAQIEPLAVPLPKSQSEWLEFSERMRHCLDEATATDEERLARRDELVAKRRDLVQEFDETAAEVRAMRKRPSNIPSKYLELRSNLARKLQLPEESLPFAGELLEVRKEERAWQGAIERVLHNFALSVLVADEHYADFTEAVEREHLGMRLVYLRARPSSSPLAAFRPRTIPSKLQLAEGPWRNWLSNELDRRFSYLCAENLDAFRNAEKAVTLRGQVKHSSERHEKDDRAEVSDRRRWVTGFSNAEKLSLFERTAQKLALDIEAAKKNLRLLEEEAAVSAKRRAAVEFVVNCDWSEIDADASNARVRSLKKELEQLLASNEDLKSLEVAIASAEAEYVNRREKTEAAKSSADRSCESLKDLEEKLDSARRRLAAEPEPDADAVKSLEVRAAKFAEALRLSDLDRCRSWMQMTINNEENAASNEISRTDATITSTFSEFLREWPGYAAELAPTLDYAQDFLRLLDRIEEDGLPRYVDRFRELLENLSTKHFAELNNEIDLARRSIVARMDIVNASLEKAPFSRLVRGESHLRIEVKNLRLPEVEDFRKALGALTEAIWETNAAEDAEARFAQAEALVKELDPDNRETARWRSLVLDVREHVNFTAYEIDDEGNVLETYLSGMGKSGGQRQKLTTTCLAAALRYQLGNADDEAPVFAPVILDEAFDKTDSEFTDISMNIFRRFGFQMIVATPEKSIMTLEPYIGGAFYVVMKDRKASSGVSIAYDDERERLAIDRLPVPASSTE